MKPLKRHFLALAIGAATIVAAPAAFSQDEPIRLSVEQMRLAADLNLRNGQNGVALTLADALLKRDPHDMAALFIRSHVLRAQAEYSAAQQAARTAWQAAQSDTDKYTAAVLMAQALSSDGKRTRAQFWLRRAAQVAPLRPMQPEWHKTLVMSGSRIHGKHICRSRCNPAPTSTTARRATARRCFMKFSRHFWVKAKYCSVRPARHCQV